MKSTIKLMLVFALSLGGVIASSTDANATTLRTAAMESAKTQKGAKYKSGAEGGYSKGYDCSGLTQWAYKQHNKKIPRTAQGQYNSSKHISAGSRKPGDLVFIKDKNGHVFHVGILTRITNGHGYMVNANSGSYRGRKVVEAPVYEYTYGSPYAVYGRY